jgi:hypothetical protein
MTNGLASGWSVNIYNNLFRPKKYVTTKSLGAWTFRMRVARRSRRLAELYLIAWAMYTMQTSQYVSALTPQSRHNIHQNLELSIYSCKSLHSLVITRCMCQAARTVLVVWVDSTPTGQWASVDRRASFLGFVQLCPMTRHSTMKYLNRRNLTSNMAAISGGNETSWVLTSSWCQREFFQSRFGDSLSDSVSDGYSDWISVRGG